MGGQLRVSVRLVSVRDGFQLWAKRFDRPAEEMLAAADEATAAIAAALTVDPPDARRAANADPVALDLYLRARHAYHAFELDGPAGARSLFEQALARAPDDAMLLSGFAMTLLRSLSLGGTADTYLVALRAAERAAEVGPHLGEAQLALAILRYHAGRHADAARHALRALEIAPSNADARAYVGRLLVESGRTAEGLAHLEMAQDLDPRMNVARMDRVRTHALLGDGGRARELFAGATGHDGPFVYWIGALRIFGAWLSDAETIATLRADLARSPLHDDPNVLAVVELGETRNPQPFLHVVDATLGRCNTKALIAFASQLRAEAYACCGRHQETLEQILLADDNGLADLLWLDGCPVLENVRCDPQFSIVRGHVKARADAIIAVLT